MLTSDDKTGLTGEEPPFLQEPTVLVREPIGRSRFDRISDFMDYQRPPFMLLLVVAVAGLGLVLYFQRSEQADPTDPLLSSNGALAGETAAAESSSPSSTISGTPATVGPDIGLPSNRPATSVAGPSTVRTTATSQPTTTNTTVGSTETTVSGTTSEPPPTTEPSSTTTDSKATSTTEVEQCIVQIRNSKVYPGPSDDSEELGRAPAGSYPAIASIDNDDGWVLIQFSEITGWVEADRIRSTEGNCG